MQLQEAEERLQQLRSGSKPITAEERQTVEKRFLACTDAWAKRKRMFKAIWWEQASLAMLRSDLVCKVHTICFLAACLPRQCICSLVAE